MADTKDLSLIVATLTGMIVELQARQIALSGLLQSKGHLDPGEYQDAVATALRHLGRQLPSFRSRTDAASLGTVEQTLRAMLLPKDVQE
jgi:hypothetical protein